jgi:hypothetical protein
VSRKLARGAFDRIEQLVARAAPRFPRSAFVVARAAGALRQRLSRQWPSAGQVALLFPHLDRPEAARLAARIAAQEAMNRVLAAAVRRDGIDYVQPLIAASAPVAAIRGPAILAIFHAGSVQALGAVLERMSAPVLAFREGLLFPPKGTLAVETTKGDALHRAGAFHRALAHLRQGNFVALAPDVVPGASIDVPCLGQTLRLSRGPFALARLTGAPLVPLIARREGHVIAAIAGDPIPAGDDETALAMALGAWLERYLTAHPEDLSVALINAMCVLSNEQ